MSGDEMVRSWKDPEQRGATAHPAGEISLDDLSGGRWGGVDPSWVDACPTVWFHCRSVLWQVCPWEPLEES